MLNTANEKYSQHLLIRADRANESFIRFVSTLRPNSHVLKLYQSVLTDIHVDMRKEIGAQILVLREQLHEKNKQIEHVEDLLVSCGGHMSRYSKILARYEKEAHELQMRIEMMETGNRTEIKPKLEYVISLIDNVVLHMSDAPVEVKIKLIGSIFDEKIEFDGEKYRTEKLNKVVELIYNETNMLRENMEQKKEAENSTSLVCAQNRTRTCTPRSTRT